jgi:hypothetical protein
MRIEALEELPFGLSWTVREAMARTSHALADGGRVWLIDPIEVPEALERVRALGAPAAVVQLLDRHDRDCAAVAARLGVPHVRLPDALPGSPFEVLAPVDVPGWRERALWWPARRALVVAEVVGTGPFYTAGRRSAGMHLFLRPRPPRGLRAFTPEHLLVGHGPGLHGPEAATGLRDAYARSRRDLPRVLAGLPRLGRR